VLADPFQEINLGAERELVRQYIRKLSHESEKVSSNPDPHLK
jgi:hypothetical protein